MIDKILIKKLFGLYDVPIAFNSNSAIKVYIGENGIGKTSVLTIINSVLTGDVSRILGIEFDGVEVVSNDRKLYLSKNDMMISLNVDKAFRRVKMALRNRLDEKEYYKMAEYAENKNILKLQYMMKQYTREEKLPLQAIIRFNEELYQSADIYEDDENSVAITSWVEYLNYLNQNPIRTMYFPTYRRIEEDIQNMGVSYDTDKKMKMVNFEDEFRSISTSVQMLKSGMRDVQDIILNIENKVKTASLESFNKVTGDMMTYLLKTDYKYEEVKMTGEDTEKIEVILNRISNNNLKEEVKNEILDSLMNNTIDKKESLVFFINSLLRYYEQQEELESQIKGFVRTCNKYLVNKRFVYNESEISIFVENKINKEIVELENLSSGEKQVISIFALIYLDQLDEKIFMLIDEPELSLSLIWQEMLLNDIYASDKVSYILAVTHSPFIYENLPEDCIENMESIFEYSKGGNS